MLRHIWNNIFLDVNIKYIFKSILDALCRATLRQSGPQRTEPHSHAKVLKVLVFFFDVRAKNHKIFKKTLRKPRNAKNAKKRWETPRNAKSYDAFLKSRGGWGKLWHSRCKFLVPRTHRCAPNSFDFNWIWNWLKQNYIRLNRRLGGPER